MLDKKVLRKSLIIILIILLILIGITFIRRAFSRYESLSKSSGDTDMALWIVNESFVSEEMYLGQIEPATDSASELLADNPVANYETTDPRFLKQIKFSIQNYNEGENGLIASVPLKYEIKLTATTNMPLEYRLYQYGDDGVLKNTECTIEAELVQDEDNTWYKQVTALPGTYENNDFYLDNKEFDGVTVEKEKDEFLLLVWFPSQDFDIATSEQENYFFADKLEHLKLEIKAEQVMSGE